MKLKSIAANQTVLTLNNGDEVFFSYETPVAAFISGRGYVKTSQKYSNTTTKHINNWTHRTEKTEPQEFFDNLVK